MKKVSFKSRCRATCTAGSSPDPTLELFIEKGSSQFHRSIGKSVVAQENGRLYQSNEASTHLEVLFLEIGLFVEISKQEVEHEGVKSDPPDEGLGVVTVDEQQLEGMDHNQNELDL